MPDNQETPSPSLASPRDTRCGPQRRSQGPEPNLVTRSVPPTWNWPAAVAVSVLCTVSVTFAYLLIGSGIAPTLACALTLVLVSGVVVCVVPARPAGAARRWLRALAALAHGDEPR